MFNWVLNTIPLKLIIKTLEQGHTCDSYTFIVDFEHSLHIGFHVYFT